MKNSQQCFDIAMLLLLLAAAAAAGVTIYLLVNLRKHKSNISKTSRTCTPPGPPAIPVIGHLHLLLNPRKAPPHKVLQTLSHRHGSVISLRLGSVPVVVASTADAAKEFLKTHDAIFASRPPSLTARILLQNSDLVLAPYGDRWRQLRRLATLELLTARRIDMFKEIRKEEVRALCQSAVESSALSGPFDVRASLSALTFNLTTFMLMSKRYFGKVVQDAEEATRIIGVMVKGLEVAGEFPIGDYLPFLRCIDPVETRMKVVSESLNGFIEANIVERENKRHSPPADFLDVMLDLRDQGEEQMQGIKCMRALMLDLLTAGTDTTSVTLEWTLAEMIKHPEVMAKAQQELDVVVGRERMVEESDLSKLEYLHAVVKESMRLHPVVPLLIPHRSTEACSVMGYSVAKDTTLIVNAYAIGRDAQVWDEPLEFRPERFTGPGQAIDVKGQHFEVIPFGAGRRMCPGMTLGLTTVHLALANLVHGFEWSECQGLEIDTGLERYGLTLVLENKLQAVCVARLSTCRAY